MNITGNLTHHQSSFHKCWTFNHAKCFPILKVKAISSSLMFSPVKMLPVWYCCAWLGTFYLRSVLKNWIYTYCKMCIIIYTLRCNYKSKYCKHYALTVQAVVMPLYMATVSEVHVSCGSKLVRNLCQWRRDETARVTCDGLNVSLSSFCLSFNSCLALDAALNHNHLLQLLSALPKKDRLERPPVTLPCPALPSPLPLWFYLT